MNVHVQRSLGHSVTRSLLTKVKAISLILFAAASLEARESCNTMCTKEILCNIQSELITDFNGTFSTLEAIEASLVNCGAPISITQADVGTTGYVIDTPGVYCLAEDIVFAPTDPATFVPVTFVGGSSDPARGFAAVSGGVVRGVFMTHHGSGYFATPTVVFGGTGVGAAGFAIDDFTTDNIAGVQMTNGGSGYQDTVQAAITITTSHVLLNFNGYELSQFVPENPSEQTPFVVGVLVPDPLPNATEPTQPNVVVTNPLTTKLVGQSSNYIVGGDGVISNFSMYGIDVFAHVADIEVRDLTIKNCGALASRAFGRPTTDGLFYLPHDTTAKSSDNTFPIPAFGLFGPSFGVAGINIGEGTGFGRGPQFFTDVPTNQLNVVNRTKNVRLSNLRSLHNFMFGAFETCITNLTIDNSHFNDSWSDDPGSNNYPQYGAVITFGTMFVDLQVTGFGDNGNTDPDNENVVISNSTFNNSSLLGDYTTILRGTTLPFVAGGIADTRSRNVTCLNCQFNSASNTFVGGTVVGWVAGGMEATTLESCSFDGLFNLGDINAFHISGASENEPYKPAKSITLINCTANDLQSRPDLVLPAPSLNQGGLTGYFLGGPFGLSIQNCQSTNLYYGGPAAGGLGVITEGFLSGIQGTDAVLENCLVSKMQNNNGGSIIGYYIDAFVDSLIAESCKSTFNKTSLASVYPAWNSATTYNVGAFASLTVSGVVNNFVSLQNGNLNHSPVPGTATAFWSPINTINPTPPGTWNVATTYGIGSLVSFTDSTGHTNEYVSTINGNVGIYPNASNGKWVQTNVYPTWNNSASYSTGMIVGYQGVSYISLITPNMGNQPDISPSDWSSNTGVGQGFAIGFGSANGGSVSVYTNCVAASNTGSPDFSSGFFTVFNNFGNVYDSCIAEQNYRGFFLDGGSRCVVRNCRADNNSFEGFTDSTVPTQSFFESNHAYNNGLASAFTGPNQNYNVKVNGGNPLATLNIQVSTGTYTYANPPVITFAHNVSAIP